MRALAHWVLGPVWQGILLAALCYVVPLGDFFAIITQTLITLRQGMTKGLVVILGSAILGIVTRVVLAWLFTEVSFVLLKESLIWALILSLPLWAFAGLLRKSVSLEFTTQIITMVFIGLFVVIHYGDINILPTVLKNAVSDSVSNLVTGVIAVQGQTQPNEVVTPEIIDQLNKFLVHLFEAVTLYMVNLSLLMFARLWQSQVFMPGEFTKEFVNIRSGKLIASLFVISWLLALILSGDLYLFLVLGTLFGVWFSFTGMSFAHWVINTYKLSWGFVIFFYILLFTPVLSGILLLILVMIGLVDGFVDLRYFTLRMRQVS